MYQFTHRAVAVPGVVAVPPGAVAPERAPRLQGLARVGGARVGGAHGSGGCLGALVDESSGVGDGQALATVVVPGPRGSPPPRFLRARIACPGAPAALSVPRAAAGGPGRRCGGRTGPVTKAVQQNPDRVGTWVKSTTQRRSAPGGGGSRGACGPSGDRVPLGGPGGAHRPARPGAGQTPAPACAAPAAHAGHPGALPPGARQAPGLPGSQRRVERLGPQGEDPLVQGGVRDRAGRWGPAAGGVIGGRGDPAPRLGQDGADPARAPQLLPCAGRCTRRISATGAHTAPL